ncbi:MAG: TolC family protein [Verrucomicrobia bacterium]|nr:TolC family protein [Verrucomicrobiota bacterium]
MSFSKMMRLKVCALLGAVWLAGGCGFAAETNGLPGWLTRPLTLADALNTAEAQSAALLQARQELDAQFGIAVQTRAIAMPKLRATSQYKAVDTKLIEGFGPFSPQDQSWNTGVQVVQSIYEGGRIQSNLRASRLTRDAALLNYQTALADTLLTVRLAYDDALLARSLIGVQEASVKLLEKELDDTKKRYDAGTVPQFNVLRAETELGNARPKLSRVRNAFRIAKQRLITELGYNLPPSVLEDAPLELAGAFLAEPYPTTLAEALPLALANRTELAALRKAEELRKEGVVSAKAQQLPSIGLFAGYGAQSKTFVRDLADPLYGWNAGAQASWDIWDGNLTAGKVQEARAQKEKAAIAVEEAGRRIELDVRTAYSTLIESWEVLASQEKVVKTAEEALRLANSRADAGTATQLDVLGAQTSLTDARTTYVQALHDYSVARARLERATGQSVKVEKK